MKENVTSEFNHSFRMDIVILVEGSLIQVFCMGTGFRQVMFSNKMSVETAWAASKLCWINMSAVGRVYNH